MTASIVGWMYLAWNRELAVLAGMTAIGLRLWRNMKALQEVLVFHPLWMRSQLAIPLLMLRLEGIRRIEVGSGESEVESDAQDSGAGKHVEKVLQRYA